MPRSLLTFVFLLAVASARAEDDLEKAVAEQVPKLGADDVAARDAALNALVKLGVKAEKAVRAAMKSAADPEIRGRLGAVLQTYTVLGEESFAVERAVQSAPFPACKPGFARISLADHPTVAAALARVREETGIRIETFPDDPELQRALEAAPFTGSSSFSGPTAAESAVWHLMCMADVTSVVDGDRVVIVRLSPAVLFARLGNEIDEVTNDSLEADLRAFEKPPVSYWLSGRRYLREKSIAGGDERQRWFELLRNRAMDASESPRGRAMALLGLSMFLGAVEQPQPDVDDVFGRLAGDPEIPGELREQAARGLAMGLSGAAQDRVLDLMEAKGADLQREVLDALIESRHFAYSVRQRLPANEGRMKRFVAALSALAASKEAGVAARATILGAWEGDAASQEKLPDLPEPAEPRAVRKFVAALQGTKTPRARERFLTFRSHKDPEIRAAFVRMVGSSAGGKDREADGELALGLLADPAPIVRCFAVRALETIFSSHAAERFNEGKDAARTRLAEAQASEKDARVLQAIRSAIEELGK